MYKIFTLITIILVSLTPLQDSRIQKIIQEENKRRGTMVDKVTRFEYAGSIENISGRKNIFFFYHTYLGDCSEFDPDVNREKLKALYYIIEASISNELSKQVKGQSRYLEIGKRGYEIHFSYWCQNGQILTSIKFGMVGNELKYIENSDEEIEKRIESNIFKKRVSQL